MDVLQESQVPTACQQAFLQSLRPGQLLEGLMDAIPGAYFFVKDRQSRFMGGNSSFAHTLGARSIHDLLGKTDYDPGSRTCGQRRAGAVCRQDQEASGSDIVGL